MAKKGEKTGKKYGGRQKGTGNKVTVAGELKARLVALGADPVEFEAHVMLGRMTCSMCLGVPTRAKVKCKRCKGTLREVLSNSVRQDAAATLMDRIEPKLKSISLGAPQDRRAGTMSLIEALTVIQQAVAD